MMMVLMFYSLCVSHWFCWCWHCCCCCWWCYVWCDCQCAFTQGGGGWPANHVWLHSATDLTLRLWTHPVPACLTASANQTVSISLFIFLANNSSTDSSLSFVVVVVVVVVVVTDDEIPGIPCTWCIRAKLHYADTGYGHVVQHHQRTSSQQF